MDIRNKIDSLKSQIKKLELLEQLMGDPEVAAMARSLLFRQTTLPSGARVSATVRIQNRLRKGKPGLKRKAFDVVQGTTKPLTAKEVTDLMEQDGFNIRSKNKTVAVSKALRSLAVEHKILHSRGEKVKAAIKYSPLPSLLSVPVQERTQ
jgi:hypothetical protein